ncbi:MAG: YkgJ family cysteine cluster protein [Candidatus Thiodiazotropha sp. (ex Ctena orbiculata)]|nr:YkgJ family cysteine cluster protein [Candidatus Thiodiazotropha taylori]MBT3034563.1 YkgJ family cysteine cluster protein [Candidatus Thiodiazotropha taylori]
MDTQAFRIEVEKERKIASKDLKLNKPTSAIKEFHRRLDNLTRSILSKTAEKLACRVGCSYCCYYKVEIRPVEVFQIVSYINQNYTKKQIIDILDKAKNNVDKAASLTYQEHLETNQKCPLLVNDCCTVYPVRPLNCRNYHATNVELCRQSYNEPNNTKIQESFIDELHVRTNGATHGFKTEVETAGYDSAVYDLNSALHEAFNNKSLIRRYNKHKKAFIKTKIIDVTE